MGAFKAGDIVKVVDYPGMTGRVGTVSVPRKPGHSFNRVAFTAPAECELYTDDEIRCVEPWVATATPRKSTPVRRPKGRFTVRQGQTLREALYNHHASPLSATRWYPR